MAVYVETDSRSRVVLPGHPNEVFIVHEREDGTLLLEPAQVVSEAQLAYDRSPDLQRLLNAALSSNTVTRTYRRRTT